jgi:GNAT superfamily N-acetyltransferase
MFFFVRAPQRAMPVSVTRSILASTMRELQLSNQADFDVLQTCIGALYTELFGADAVPDADTFARLRSELVAGAAPAHWAFVSCDTHGSPVAFVTLGEAFAIFARGHYGVINELWVRADSRSAGHGEKAIDFVKEFGRRRGWRRVDVSAPVDPRWDRSAAFYERRGFVRTGRKLKYMLDASR